MPVPTSFDYAIVRVVPRVERGEFINVGVIVFCRARRFLGAHVELDVQRLKGLAPWFDPETVAPALAMIPRICDGGPDSGPIGALPQAERFHWLVAPRSTVVQTSPVHVGLCQEPRAALDNLLKTMVRPL